MREQMIVFDEVSAVVERCNRLFQEGWETTPRSIQLKKGRESRLFMIILLERFHDEGRAEGEESEESME